MSDLISRKQIAEEVKSLRISITGLRAGKGALCLFATEYIKSVLKLIDEAPSVEAEPKRGRWEKVIPTKSAAKWSTKVSCSVCHRQVYTRCKYCHNCGAKMDLEVDE